MKRKILLRMLFLIAGIGAFDANAQNLFIKTTDGSESVKQLSSLQKLSFSAGDLVVTYKGDSTNTYSLSTLSKLYFKTSSTGDETTSTLNERAGIMSIYPNPVGNSIYIQNAPQGTTTVRIFRMDGMEVLCTQVSSDQESIDASNLTKGLYLLKMNSQVFKFIKL